MIEAGTDEAGYLCGTEAEKRHPVSLDSQLRETRRHSDQPIWEAKRQVKGVPTAADRLVIYLLVSAFKFCLRLGFLGSLGLKDIFFKVIKKSK